MRISQKQILENGKEQLMSSREDFHANRSVWPEREREQKITATSGRNLNVPYGKSNRLGLLVRMLLASYQWYNPARRLTWKISRLRSTRINKSLSSKPSARTLKPKDILSNRLLYRLVPSVHPIEETESGSSLITTASDYEKKGAKENRIRMAEYLRTNLLQTPTTVQRCEAPEKMKERTLKKGYRNGTTYNSLLSQLVYGGLLPTPQAADSSIGAVIGQNDRFIITKNGMFRKVNQNGSNGSVGLGRIFHLMSTPTAIGLEGRLDKEKSLSPENESAWGNTCGLRYWEDFPTQPPICRGDDGISDLLDTDAIFKGSRSIRQNSYSKWRTEAIKAYGNAMVPQVIYQIYKTINEIEQ